jgi:hypothetical protein
MKLPNPKKLTNKALIKFAKNEIAEWNGFLKKLKANTEMYGKRCKDYQARCPVCEMYELYDEYQKVGGSC